MRRTGKRGTRRLWRVYLQMTDLFSRPGQPLVRGRAAIQKLYTGPGAPVSLRAFAYAMHGKVGYIIGGFSPEPGTPDEGKFTVTLRKDKHGRWLIVSDMDNFNRRRP